MNDKKITGKSVADAIFKDVEGFFYFSKRFLIKREYNSNICGPATYIGSGSNSRIKLSEDLCEKSVVTPEDFFLVALIICHEIAHYISFHNDHTDRDKMDSVAIEARADNVGAIIFMVILTCSENVNNLLRKLVLYRNGNDLIPLIGQAVGTLYKCKRP